MSISAAPAKEKEPVQPPHAKIYWMRVLLAVVSLGCVLGMLVIPPLSGGTRDDTDRLNPTTEYWITYTPIVDPPDSDVPVGVNWGVLTLQLAFCAVATGVLWFLAGWMRGGPRTGRKWSSPCLSASALLAFALSGAVWLRSG